MHSFFWRCFSNSWVAWWHTNFYSWGLIHRQSFVYCRIIEYRFLRIIKITKRIIWRSLLLLSWEVCILIRFLCWWAVCIFMGIVGRSGWGLLWWCCMSYFWLQNGGCSTAWILCLFQFRSLIHVCQGKSVVFVCHHFRCIFVFFVLLIWWVCDCHWCAWGIFLVCCKFCPSGWSSLYCLY